MKSYFSPVAALVSIVVLAGAVPAGAAPATAPSTAPAVDPKYAALVERNLKELADGSDDERQVAFDWLLNSTGQTLPLIEAAAKRPGIDDDTRGRLTDLAARHRRLNEFRAAQGRANQEEFDWNLRTALAAYDRNGRHDPKWDDLARKAITQFVSRHPAERAAAFETLEHVTSDLKCDDPLVLYFDARALELDGDRETDREKKGRRYGQAMNTYSGANIMFAKSDYPADRKCYSLARPVSLAYRTTAKEVPQITADAKKWSDAALVLWPEAVKTKGISTRFLLEIADLILDSQVKSGGDRGAAADKMFPPFEQAFPKDPAPLAMKGRAYTDWAWDARGFGYANTVTPDRWKTFKARLQVAADALQKAYDMDPAEPRALASVAMMRVEIGQGRGRAVMEKWFKRATDVAPDATPGVNYPSGSDAYWWKLEYLQPRWYGSDAAVLEYGRQCLATRNWAGQVTWVLVTAHQRLADAAVAAGGTEEAYFHQPAVWKDIEQVVGGRVRMNPADDNAVGVYAYWAWKCGQWAVADREFKLLGNRPPPVIAAGSEKFEQARAESARRAAEGK